MSTPSLWQIQAPSRGHDRLRGDVSADVCIVGAGVTGGACAWRLLEHGLRPVVLDAREVAASASGRNGGFAVGSSRRSGRTGRSARWRRWRPSWAWPTLCGGGEACGWAARTRRTRCDQAVTAARADGLPVEDALDRVPGPMRGRFAAAAFFPGDGELEPARWVRALVGGGGRPRRGGARALAGDGGGVAGRRVGRADARRRRCPARRWSWPAMG